MPLFTLSKRDGGTIRSCGHLTRFRELVVRYRHLPKCLYAPSPIEAGAACQHRLFCCYTALQVATDSMKGHCPMQCTAIVHASHATDNYIIIPLNVFVLLQVLQQQMLHVVHAGPSS